MYYALNITPYNQTTHLACTGVMAMHHRRHSGCKSQLGLPQMSEF